MSIHQSTVASGVAATRTNAVLQALMAILLGVFIIGIVSFSTSMSFTMPLTTRDIRTPSRATEGDRCMSIFRSIALCSALVGLIVGLVSASPSTSRRCL